ncbi:MAG: hypothetical protein J0L92_36925 [Deltaproteobacteria bacterium]|nr:hypothetical protein [Deltaproteobacteria bacterium]
MRFKKLGNGDFEPNYPLERRGVMRSRNAHVMTLSLVIVAAWHAGCRRQIIVRDLPDPGPLCDEVGTADPTLEASLERWRASQATAGVDFRPLVGHFSAGREATTDEATAMFRDVYDAALVTRWNRRRSMEWSQARNNCEDRAHAAAAYLRAHYEDIAIGKVFIASDVNGTLGADEAVMWGYHVAPVVLVAEGEALVPWVIDPAVDRSQPLPLNSWIDALRRAPDDSTRQVYVYLTGPGIWDFAGGAPIPSVGRDRSDAFCETAAEARDQLADFAAHPPITNLLIQARFAGRDGDRVRFTGSRGTAFGPFSVDAGTRAYLESLSPDTAVDVRVQRLYGPQDQLFVAFTNAWGWMTNGRQAVVCIVDAPAPYGCRN